VAFPVVETTNESSLATAGTSHIVSLPSGIVAGNLILVLLDKGSTSASFNALAGWTEIVDEALANGIAIWAREADGTEGATVTFTSTASTRSAHISYRISGAADLLTQQPQVGTVVTGTSVSPTAGATTPTGGAKDYLWITMFGTAGEEADDDTWVNSAPTNYGTLIQKACGTAGTNLGGMIGSAHRTANAASEDAGTFNKDVSSAWRAYTVAVHPASASILVTDTFDRTASDTVGNDSNGNAWVERAGDWDIASNGVIQTNATTVPGCLLCGTDMAVQGHWIEAPLALSDGSGQIGLLVRLDATAFTALSFEVADGAYKLIEVSGGTPNTVFTGSAHTHATGEVYAAEVDTANNVRLYLNGSVVASTTSAFNVGDTRVGFHINESNSGAIRWGEFRAGAGPYPGLASGTTGTIAVTQDAQTSSATGQLGYSGTIAVIQADQTSSVSGTVANPITGTAAVTQESQTSTASGQLGYVGTVAAIQADQTSSASGTVGSGITGTVVVTQEPQASAATGVLGYVGTIVITQADQTSAAAGVLGYSGSLAETQDDQASAAAGTVVVPITGSLAVVQANQISTAAGATGTDEVDIWLHGDGLYIDDPGGDPATPALNGHSNGGFIQSMHFCTSTQTAGWRQRLVDAGVATLD